MSPDGRAARIGGRARIAIDVAGALGLTGTLLAYLSLSSLVPTVVAVGYGEPFWPFLAAGAIAGGLGLGLARLGRRSRGPIGFREGYLVVSLTWLLAALYAGLPYILSGEPQLSHPMDAFFEGMSGFTTTGATVVTDVESLDRSILIWRQLSQWLGGMGIIVLALAVLPRLRIGGRQMFESELPGAGGEPTRRAHPRHRPQAVAPLHRAHAGPDRRPPRRVAHRARRRPDAVRRGRERAFDDASRRLRDRQPLARAVRPSRNGSSSPSWRSPA